MDPSLSAQKPSHQMGGGKMAIVHVLINTSHPEIFKNGTIFHIDDKTEFKDSELNELLYVVIVIMFYAMALMILIATQIRKQRRGQDIEYYDEHLERNKSEKKSAQLILQKGAQKTEQKFQGGTLEAIEDEKLLETKFQSV
ncbi:hypothetical protein FSP39_007615 [Pinctada imbricata]|uniref:Uncharacterized protein n=1 Tax=Pinctada imbricata TaxID=66713 RepID=A0AA88XQI1_PINIB|nr:hypothetical protein FSP39_007615 [Pinctada imbricata]